MKPITFIIAALLSFYSQQSISLNYYVDSIQGIDANDGKTPATAWRTIPRVNKARFLAGDGILFRRNSIWADSSLKISQTNLTIDAYGTGAAPELQGARPITGWTLYTKNIFRAFIGKDLKTTYKDVELVSEPPDIFYRKTTSLNTLTSPQSFYFDKPTGYLYLITSTQKNPSTTNIIYGSVQNIIELQNAPIQNLQIRNVKLSYSGRYGIGPWYQSGGRAYGDLHVQSVIFWGNALSAICLSGTNTFNNVEILNNTIRQNGAEGIYIGKNNTRSRLLISYNTIGNEADTSFGWNGEGASSPFNGDGIDVKLGNVNVLISGNTVTNVLGLGIVSQTANSLIESNTISNAYLPGSADAAGILVDPQDATGNVIVRNNKITAPASNGVAIRGSLATRRPISIQNNAISLTPNNGYAAIGFTATNASNVTIQGNQLSGGTASLKISGEPPSGITLSDNRIASTASFLVINSAKADGLLVTRNTFCLDGNATPPAQFRISTFKTNSLSLLESRYKSIYNNNAACP